MPAPVFLTGIASMSDTHARRPVEGEGEDENPSPYPTYRDGPVPPHMATATKPTDVKLPQSRRTYSWSALAAVGIALIIGIGLVIWGSAQLGSGNAPPLGAEGPSERVGAGPTIDESGTAPQAPAEATPEPGAVDVPGAN
jgi:hypothetical protein